MIWIQVTGEGRAFNLATACTADFKWPNQDDDGKSATLDLVFPGGHKVKLKGPEACGIWQIVDQATVCYVGEKAEGKILKRVAGGIAIANAAGDVVDEIGGDRDA